MISILYMNINYSIIFCIWSLVCIFLNILSSFSYLDFAIEVCFRNYVNLYDALILFGSLCLLFHISQDTKEDLLWKMEYKKHHLLRFYKTACELLTFFFYKRDYPMWTWNRELASLLFAHQGNAWWIKHNIALEGRYAKTICRRALKGETNTWRVCVGTTEEWKWKTWAQKKTREGTDTALQWVYRM